MWEMLLKRTKRKSWDFTVQKNHVTYFRSSEKCCFCSSKQIIIIISRQCINNWKILTKRSSECLHLYRYSLFAECTMPTPKGPISIKPVGITPITFTNPFMEPHTFQYITDRYFTVKTTMELLKPKKQTKINVMMNSPLTDYPLTGKLTIISTDELRDIKWVYYLQSENHWFL